MLWKKKPYLFLSAFVLGTNVPIFAKKYSVLSPRTGKIQPCQTLSSCALKRIQDDTLASVIYIIRRTNMRTYTLNLSNKQTFMSNLYSLGLQAIHVSMESIDHSIRNHTN